MLRTNAKKLRELSRQKIKELSKKIRLSPLKLRPRIIKRISKTAGLSPGTLVYVGKKKVEKVRIFVMDYDDKHLKEKEVKNIEECFPFKETSTVTWINISGIHETKIIEKMGKHFNLHPLIQEDIVNTGQRPKIEDFSDHIFIVLKMLSFDEENATIKAEQLSLIIGPNFVISFQESSGDIFEPIRDRIRNINSRHRKGGSDYLAYSIIDTVVDNYYTILEKVGEHIESIEDALVEDPKHETLQIIHRLKREMIIIRRSVWPLREVIGGLERTESKMITKKTAIYLRDVYDHTIQVIDTIETFRDILSGMLDLYLSGISNRMNEVMKVLTIIATIFIPLTFIVGIYGMNFRYMPELGWRYGYFAVWGIIAMVAIAMVLYFRKKHWL